MSEPRDRAPADHGCAEYRTLKRRQFLQAGVHAAAAGFVLGILLTMSLRSKPKNTR